MNVVRNRRMEGRGKRDRRILLTLRLLLRTTGSRYFGTLLHESSPPFENVLHEVGVTHRILVWIYKIIINYPVKYKRLKKHD